MLTISVQHAKKNSIDWLKVSSVCGHSFSFTPREHLCLQSQYQFYTNSMPSMWFHCEPTEYLHVLPVSYLHPPSTVYMLCVLTHGPQNTCCVCSQCLPRGFLLYICSYNHQYFCETN